MTTFSFPKKHFLVQACITKLNIIFFLFSFIVYGQEKVKKPITTTDYTKWGKLNDHSLSEKGNWVSYYMQYHEAPDTLFVGRINEKKRYVISNANKGKFLDEQQFVTLDQNKTLHLINLIDGTTQTINGINSYIISANNRYFITLEQQGNKSNLCIRNREGKIQEQFQGVTEFKMNNVHDAMVCIIEKENAKNIVVIKLDETISKSKISEPNQEKFSNLTWSESNESLVFTGVFKDNPNRLLYHYILKQDRLFKFNPKEIENFPNNFQLSTVANSLTISPDDKRVIFRIAKNPSTEKKADSVQIWNGNDPLVYSHQKQAGTIENKFRVAVWWPQTGEFRKITEENRPYCILNNSKDFALTYSSVDMPVQYTMSPNVNYYVNNLATGEQKLLLENQLTGLPNSSMSPKGTYFAYFTDNNWWVYDFKKHEKIKLPKPNTLNYTKLEYANENGAFGVAGWSPNDDYLLLYDRYDIWKVSFNGKNPKRLTMGSEKKITFKVISDNIKSYSPYSGNNDPVINLNQEILLSATNDNETGYFFLKPNGKLKSIIFSKSLHSKISKATKADRVIFQSQNYNSPPSLIYYDPKTEKQSLIFQSNKHHYNYQWTKQEIIKYKNSKNEWLSGILYYPATYDSTQKYPMVVFVYEEQNYRQHYYTNPTKHNPTGFNPSSLTAAGYFVFQPDIKYELGNPGLSAADCVIAATNKVISLGLVDTSAIALMGQSFGGYETNFILTQTNLFKAAISGVSIFDLNSMYLSLSLSSGAPELWRFESQQWRMGKSLFDDRKGYERNSPSSYVEKITAPILIWTGVEDKQVNTNQSISLYLALRRLDKKCILLMYPKESHSLLLKESQKDLYHRIDDWLAYYLKNEPAAQWIIKGIN